MLLNDQQGTILTQDCGAAATTGVGIMNYLDTQQAAELIRRLHVLADGRVDFYQLMLAFRRQPLLYFAEVLAFGFAVTLH